jgi:hypothetical protein
MQGWVPAGEGQQGEATAEGKRELQVKAVTQALLAAAQMRDMATNTGGVRWAPQRGAPRKVLSADQIVRRMRVTYPMLTAARVDPGLRQLFIAELIS